MRTMLKTMRDRLSRGDALVLVTITAASGATPRGTGARMLVGREGRICGTIGGGAVEYRCQQRALQLLEQKTSARQAFSLTRDDVQDLGMICGGAVNVFFHYLAAGDPAAIALADKAEQYFASGTALWLLSNTTKDGALSLYTARDGFFGAPVPPQMAEHLAKKPQHTELDGESFCTEQINSAGRVYIFGGGHVSQQLEPLLTRIGFRCVVLDDRPEFADPALFPTAEEVLPVDFTRILDTVRIGPEDYVCIMTRGHAYDAAIQAQVLACRPCYTGVIGSRKKAAGVRRLLKEAYGLADELLDRVTTPIGLDIGAETPAEIAVSIAAQMLQLRAQLKN